MNKKPQKSWGEIQLAIAATALAVTLALWNMFATPQKQVVAQSQDTTVPPDPTGTPAPTSTQGLSFLPIKIIFGGALPQATNVAPTVVAGVPAPPAPQPKHRGGGGGGPPIRSGSSKP